jgi:hypothetical protein
MLSACAALLTWTVVCGAGDAPEPTETVIRLRVTPAAEPKPALFYQLLPELRDMNPGNPVPGYLKCFSEQNNFWFSKEAEEKREKWRTMPLKDLPREEMRTLGYGTGTNPLRLADEAAKLEHADWQALLPLRREGINLIIPEVQQMRTLAVALRVRCRLEIAEKRYGDAVVTLKTMFALARHLGEHPTLIAGLVGVAVASMAAETLDEFSAQPGAPNLYWALTDLPRPLIALRPGMQGERAWLGAAFEGIPARAPLPDWQVQRLIKLTQLLADVSMESRQKKIDVRAWLTERGKDAAHLEAARKRLVETGFPPGPALDNLSPIQVILVDEVVAFEVKRDNQMKLMMLPYWQFEAMSRDRPAAKQPPDDSLFGGLVAAFVKVRRAHARIEQRVGLLRCVEALRLYAAAHQGQLPASLADVSVPLPADPMTGRPFTYAHKDGTATLHGTPPAGLEKNAGYNVRYEVTVAK